MIAKGLLKLTTIFNLAMNIQKKGQHVAGQSQVDRVFQVEQEWRVREPAKWTLLNSNFNLDLIVGVATHSDIDRLISDMYDSLKLPVKAFNPLKCYQPRDTIFLENKEHRTNHLLNVSLFWRLCHLRGALIPLLNVFVLLCFSIYLPKGKLEIKEQSLMNSNRIPNIKKYLSLLI
jgi:hypothetical protein